MDAAISVLGPARWRSPLALSSKLDDGVADFVSERTRVRDSAEELDGAPVSDLRFEKAGPRERIYFDPAHTRAAIVTCGGLCPGLNSVIRSAVMELHHNYGVGEVLGIRYGYQGLDPAAHHTPLPLTPDGVDTIHRLGGTILGSSRGSPPVPAIVDCLAAHGIHILLAVGGDGTQRGALEIAQTAQTRGLDLAVVGVPKTVDNDLLYVDRTFGYATAIDRARDVLSAAHAESKGYLNGVVIVRLMGRDSGFIAVGATLASQEVNFTLIPESPFRLDGTTGLLEVLQRRILARRHAVIAVAEGAGQDLLSGARFLDASGNRANADIGAFLRDRIVEHFRNANVPVAVKLIDPSYTIRSVPANSDDSILCDQYARHAVHAAMAGKTGMVVGLRSEFIHVPIGMATASRQRVPLEGALWRSVLASTGQPPSIG